MRNAGGIKVPCISFIVNCQKKNKSNTDYRLYIFWQSAQLSRCVSHDNNQEAQKSSSFTYLMFYVWSLFLVFFSCCLKVRCHQRSFIKFSLQEIECILSIYIDIISICMYSSLILTTKKCLSHSLALLSHFSQVQFTPFSPLSSFFQPSLSANKVKVSTILKRGANHIQLIFFFSDRICDIVDQNGTFEI